MSSFEVGACNISEYIANEGNRVEEKNITIGSLYTIMFLLKNAKKAAKYPTRILNAEPYENVGREIEMLILNADLAPDIGRAAFIKDGYWQKRKSQGVLVGEVPVISGYLKPYHDNVDVELQDIFNIANQKPNNVNTEYTAGMRGH